MLRNSNLEAPHVPLSNHHFLSFSKDKHTSFLLIKSFFYFRSISPKTLQFKFHHLENIYKLSWKDQRALLISMTSSGHLDLTGCHQKMLRAQLVLPIFGFCTHSSANSRSTVFRKKCDVVADMYDVDRPVMAASVLNTYRLVFAIIP